MTVLGDEKAHTLSIPPWFDTPYGSSFFWVRLVDCLDQAHGPNSLNAAFNKVRTRGAVDVPCCQHTGTPKPPPTSRHRVHVSTPHITRDR